MMLSIDDFKPFIEWLQANPSLATLAVFLISCAESLALVGLFIPGTIVMPAIGSMIGSGVLPAEWIITGAVLGAIVGDNLSFWLGHYFHESIRQKWPFCLFPNLMDKGENFFNRYGSLSVFIGRFVGPVRPIIPVIAGMLNMPGMRFFIANVTSAIAWAILYMAPGILLGMISEQLAPTVAARALVILALVTLALWLALWIMNKLWSLSHLKLETICSHWWQKITATRPALGELVHHLSLDNPKPLLIVFYIFFFLILTVLLLSGVKHSPFIHSIDSFIYLFLRGIQVAPLDILMAQLFLISNSLSLGCLAIGPFLWFLLQKNWRVAWYWSANLLATWGLTLALQHCVIISSPNFAVKNDLIGTHLAIFCALLGNFLLLTYYRNIWMRYKKPLWVILQILILLVTLPQIYFGFHWPTGCLLSMACAAMCTWTSILFFYRTRTHLRLNIKPPLIIFFLIALVLLITNGINQVPVFLRGIVKEEFWLNYSAKLWLAPEKSLPIVLFRTNFIGNITEPMTLQYAGNLTRIEQALHKAGWHTAPPPSLMVILNRIGAKDRTDQLPLLPDLYQAKKPVLIMTKISPNLKRMLVLRLWSSQVLLQPHRIPLWIGTVSFHKVWRWHTILPGATFVENRNLAIELFEADLLTTHAKSKPMMVECYTEPDCQQLGLKFYYPNNLLNEQNDETD